MTTNISELAVSLNSGDENTLLSQGFTKVKVNLNDGTEGNIIYLWYKCGQDPITRVQLTFNYEMGVGLASANYTKISKNLNTGTEGDPIYLWYFKGKTANDVPIQQIDVTTDAENEAVKFTQDWERLACDLNRGAGGKMIYAWVKREKQTYICEVTATAAYDSVEVCAKDGFIRVDEDTNKGAGGSPVFIWYRLTNDIQNALNFLQVSTNDTQMHDLQLQKYKQVKVDLNEGTGKNHVYLWSKKQGSINPIKAISLLLDKAQIQAYETAGVNVIKRNLNQGTAGHTEYLCVNQNP
ncbi:uncharacterized protein LOC129095274 [Anoplopoma fimbria]|uniref:uncharacterized protein LOC129095274 n=1 Tax=Anoplopoma fimbria TaxID=229290 RepID=UPI0023EC3213|nr:uncharacterized protein LOC129095274 [Anoplopoma fimbria]XP_054459631.1 uncharacterized protein LOC129095274 [Anoplopoma fimbria]